MSSPPAASKIVFARSVSAEFSEWTEMSALPPLTFPSKRLASYSGMPMPTNVPVRPPTVPPTAAPASAALLLGGLPSTLEGV